MATSLRIDAVSLTTSAREYYFDFTSRCTILDGPVGTGKSSLLELIKYSFGGNAVLTPVVKSEVQVVTCWLRLAGEPMTLRRSLGRDSQVVHIDGDTTRGVYPVKPTRSSDLTVGKALLQTLGLPSVALPRARSRATAAKVALTFNDLFSYVYIEQQGIDRSIVHHTETFREPKRRAMFELLFDLVNVEMLQLEARIGELNDALKTAQIRSETIQSFLRTASEFDEPVIRDRVLILADQERVAAARLEELRQATGSLVGIHASLRARVDAAERQAREAEDDLRLAELEVARRREFVAQVSLDLAREEKTLAASFRLAPLEFVSCPRCMQSIEPTRASRDHCMLCLQATEVDTLTQSDGESLGELDALIDEAQGLLGLSKADAEKALQLAAEAATALQSLRGELDQATTGAVLPRFEAIALLSAEQARASADLAHSKELLRYWEEFHGLENEVRQLGYEREEARSRLKVLQQDRESRRNILDELSELFDETVQTLGVPWADNARIDPRTFLPLVNEQRFEDLAVAGGTKTVVTVAYHLTLLAFALSRNEILLPSILIIDTPRKNLGANDSDAELGARIYARIRTLIDSNQEVQFIIADNDVPTNGGWMHDIHFDYDNPLIAHVTHPGEDAVLAGELPTVGAAN